MLGFECVDNGCAIGQNHATPYHAGTLSNSVQPKSWRGYGRKMLAPKYMSEEMLFDTLGDFAMELLTKMADESQTPEERAKWLSHTVEGLTTQLWEELPLRRGAVPSIN